MSAPSAAARLLNHAGRRIARAAVRPQQMNGVRLPTSRIAPALASNGMPKHFTTTSGPLRAGLMPDSENPQPPQSEANASPRAARHIDDEEYHLHADYFMNKIHERAEQLVEERDDVEVEYAAGVLSIKFPPNGTYVINKQPPNKQIWLSSPLTGPKRFDWALHGDSMQHKEGGATGEWIYLRDETSLSDLLRKEIGIDVTLEEI